MIITSLDNPYIKDIKKLNERKYRDLEELFIIEGEHLVLEAYKNGYLKEIITTQENYFDFDVKQTIVTDKVMSSLSLLTTPSTVIGICQKLSNNNKIGNRILVLDSIQDPGNLGTIIRSAAAFNIDTIILGDGTVDLYNPKVLRASQGLIFNVNIVEGNLIKIIESLKKDNYIIIGTSLKDGFELKSYKSFDKYAIIMGNEGQGMSKELIRLCDDFIHIDMNNNCESLNVGVACSIILYQLNKR